MNLRSFNLPAVDIADRLCEVLRCSGCAVVTAPPGAGKSTLLPLALLEGFEGRIVMLEPRRLAARQIAERMASMMGEAVGQTVGYKVRFESKVSSATRVMVVTEGVFIRMMVEDPTLEGVSVVIFDEFHERSLASDEALALTREARSLLRPDLRLVIMSATIDASAICEALGAEHIHCEGRMFPVRVFGGNGGDGPGCFVGTADGPAGVQGGPVYTPKGPSEAAGVPGGPVYTPKVSVRQEATEANCAEVVAHAVREAWKAHDGDILAFLPGEGEIRKCAVLLEGAIDRVYPLYGMLAPEEQRKAIAPSRPGERKVVLATPVAETSVTIEGVRVVIDSGLCRAMEFDPQSGLSRLIVRRISRDMADQRAGRAGRVAPGVCYRLWSAATDARMNDCRKPEIMDADLAPMVLEVGTWGESHPESLTWLTPPPSSHIASAKSLLACLGAIDRDKVTVHGRRLSSLPCHPRIAQMLVKASTVEEKSLAADLAAILEEKDILQEAGSDLSIRVDTLRKSDGKGRWSRIWKIAEQYRKMVRAPKDSKSCDPFEVGSLIASAYPERIARLRSGQAYTLACSDSAFLDAGDSLAGHDWLAVASLGSGSGRIFLAAPVSPEDLKSMARQCETSGWDSRKGAVRAALELRIGALVLDSRDMPISAEMASEAICKAVAKEGLTMLDFSEDVANLQRRIACVASWHPELGLPDMSTDTLLQTASLWLAPFVGKAATIAELKKIDLCKALWATLTYSQQQEVDRLAPTHIEVPTGSHIRVEYRQGADHPVLRVRLQECFGLADTPRVDGGRMPVLMELLSPGYKPVQLTTDLRSFWSGTYFEVRAELRRRYPKHSWPDNPLEAQAVRGVKSSRS